MQSGPDATVTSCNMRSGSCQAVKILDGTQGLPNFSHVCKFLSLNLDLSWLGHPGYLNIVPDGY